jgi:hypothetical protein
MSTPRRKGTAAESTLVRLLRALHWPHAERRALNGSKDRGDVAGVPGVVFEVKSGARLELPAWLRETEAERVNDRADYGVLVVKLKGYGDARAHEWPAVLPVGALLELLAAAGYAPTRTLTTVRGDTDE